MIQEARKATPCDGEGCRAAAGKMVFKELMGFQEQFLESSFFSAWQDKLEKMKEICLVNLNLLSRHTAAS